ncbi:olfactory receptor 2K2-like [Spea bombifrons]|uniref:olfactory receptor 2K2-like n=1 Tax=Spea bombifrons TaxID=233779 RepID=UPI002349FF46|nr:olfactory receptor 2K2-like [Spea bombifrons]
MEIENQTVITEFILTGLSQNQTTKKLLFVLFLLVYILTIFGNIFLICAVIANSRMHTPMYYFLCNLSFLDLLYTLSTVPKLLSDLLSAGRGRISYIGCSLQMNISLFLGETECILLAVMAYDRYIAICFPLRYMVIMSWRICKNITVVVWLGSFACSILPTVSSLRPICKGNQINHFICEVIALMKLVCGDTSFDESKIIFASFFTLLVPLAFILVSYMCIIASILKIHSAEGRTKAFSTCASHLTVVLMFYGTSMSLYLGPTKQVSQKHKYISVVYVVVTPMLNPLIYSLRNNEVKGAFRKMLNRNSLFLER